MAWTDAHGRVTCEHGAYRRGRSCPTCAENALNPVGHGLAVPTLGEFEKMLAAVGAEGLPTRVDVIRLLMERIRMGDREAMFYGRRGRKVLREGLIRVVTSKGEEMRLEADADTAATKWFALKESARNRTDKLARALFNICGDTERIADLERRERLAAKALGRASPTRGTA